MSGISYQYYIYYYHTSCLHILETNYVVELHVNFQILVFKCIHIIYKYIIYVLRITIFIYY